MTNTVINVMKLNVIENTGIHNVVKPKNNANPEPNVAPLANPNVKLSANALFKTVWNIRPATVNIIPVNNASNNLGNLTLIKIDWLNTSLISPNCQNRYMLVVIINMTIQLNNTLLNVIAFSFLSSIITFIIAITYSRCYHSLNIF